MSTNINRSDLSNVFVNSLEAALSDGGTHRWSDLWVSRPIPGHADYGIIVRSVEHEGEEKGFSISLCHNFSEKTPATDSELLCAFAPLDNAYESLVDGCDKLLGVFERSLKTPVPPIHLNSPYSVYTKEMMQPLLDALNAGDFSLAEELTPSKYRLCGYQEFDSPQIVEVCGRGWAGQFENTVVPAGRYPVFAQQYSYLEKDMLYSNQLKDFQGLCTWVAGECISSSDQYRAPEDYPFANTVFQYPYCHAVAHDILEHNSSIHLLPTFKAEPVSFEYNGEQHVTYKIVDESLPQRLKQNPMSLRNMSSYIRKTMGLSEKAKRLYDTFLREYSYSLGFGKAFISLNALSQDESYSVEALTELIAHNKVQFHDGSDTEYELTAAERLDLFHSGQIHTAEREPFKWKAEYERCTTESKKKRPLEQQIQLAFSRTQNPEQASGANEKEPALE